MTTEQIRDKYLHNDTPEDKESTHVRQSATEHSTTHKRKKNDIQDQSDEERPVKATKTKAKATTEKKTLRQ